MKRKPVRTQNEDLRDFPTYTIPEAALFLGIPARTLRSWFAGEHHLLAASGRVGEVPLLSFNDAVNAYAIYMMRAHYKLSMPSVKRALRELKKYTKVLNPLVSENLKVFEDSLLLERPARGKQPRQIINLSRDSQLVIPPVADLFASRVLKDSKGKTVTISPWRFWSHDQTSRPVQIDPSIMSGRLVITGTRIPVSILEARKRSGETLKSIADDYGLLTESVEKALQHLDKKAA